MVRARVLSIAGSDPSGGAGIQADLKSFAAWGCYGMAVVTALTAQDTTGVHAVHAVPPEFVDRCLDAVLTDCAPAATKTGMLFDAEVIRVVADRLARGGGGPLVVDPVMVATSGDPLLEPGAVASLVERLLPLATLVTPNADEAALLAGVPVVDERSAWDTADRIARLSGAGVLVKGGHLRGAMATDFLRLPDGSRVRFERPFLAGVRAHGTGCTLSAAIAAGLARGLALTESVRRAGDWVHAALAGATPIGRGATPLDHGVPVPELET